MEKIDMKDIVNLSQARWFVYPWSEIYGWLANAWDYGPYWVLLKENIKNLWIKEFVQKKDNMVMLDAAILMNPKVWVASGHVWGFADPLMDCKSCKQRLRADKLIEDYIEKSTDTEFPKEWAGEWTPNEYLTEYITKKNIVCPFCWKTDFSEIRKFNLMFKTSQWVTEDKSSEIFLRPETAQWIFVDFPHILRTSRKKIPFWVAQIWKSFRNEITPGNFIFRTREFEQMEIEYFCQPGSELENFKKWKEDCFNFIRNTIWINENSLRFRDHSEDELSHYSNATTDIEYKFPFWWWELMWIASRTDFDLKAHMKESKADMSYFDPITNRKYIPYVIEPSLWLTRLFLVTLMDSYIFDKENNRTYLKLNPKIAPIKIWVLPVIKKIWEEAKKIFAQLSENFMCEYDEVWTIGKRYARMDEIGTPFCVTIDSENYENWKVTVRFRDSMKQELIEINNLNNYINNNL